jgi:hypothetical protein
VLFDLPASQVTEGQLRELYAAEGGLPIAGAPASAIVDLSPLRCS